MGMGETLVWATVVIGGGYILVAHVIPSLVQQGAGEFLQGFEKGYAETGGQFLPSGQTKCWEIGDGSRACSCQGKQYTKMGKLRPCEDCYQMCGGGGLPDRGRPTNNPVPPKVTNPDPRNRCTVQQFTTNCLRNTACQYCWYSTGKSACTNVQGCSAARSAWLAKWSSGPTNVPPTRPTTGPASGTQETYNCTVIATGTTGRRWQCRGAKSGRVVLQGPAWTCFGATAQQRGVGATCTTIS